MFCPKCGRELCGDFADHPGVTCLLYDGVCKQCGIQYAMVIDEQIPEYVDIHGEPEAEEEGKEEANDHEQKEDERE